MTTTRQHAESSSTISAVREQPIRVQLSRKAGFKLPPNTVSVSRGRGRKYGNPFPVPKVEPARQLAAQKATVDLYAAVLSLAHLKGSGFPRSSDLKIPTLEEIRRDLRGKNLACWCKPGEPCHADVLLEIANR